MADVASCSSEKLTFALSLLNAHTDQAVLPNADTVLPSADTVELRSQLDHRLTY